MVNKRTLVNINHASAEELTTINGIGANLADRIINNRPFKALHDLVNIPGISETILASLLPYITIGSTSSKKTPAKKRTQESEPGAQKPMATLGETESFVFLEDRNERQDALLIIFGGFILGLIILLLRRAHK